MYRAVLFDIDNTLLLKKPSVAEMVFQTLCPRLPGLALEQVEMAYAQSEQWQGEQIMRENESGVRMDGETYLYHVFLAYQEGLGLPGEMFPALRPVFTGAYPIRYEKAPAATETLKILQSRGIRLGIVSNHTAAVRDALAGQGLTGYFDPIVISAEVDLYKPDPRILELASQGLGIPCTDCLYVGDHPFDILCAHRAHMAAAWMPVNRFMAVPDSIGPAEHRLRTLADLPAMV